MPTLPASALVPGIGSADGLDVGLRASTALEGPQVLLEWSPIAFAADEFRILRKPRHTPANETDGEVVFSATRTPDVNWHADLTVMPYRFYHYAAFVRFTGRWARVGMDWAWSGEAPHLEDSGTRTTIAAGSTVGSYATAATLTSASGISAGDWLLVGAAQRLIVRVLKVNGSVVRFERIGAFEAPKMRTVRGVRMSFVTATGIIRRTTGSWVADGLKVGQRVRIGRALSGTGANGITSVIGVGEYELRVDKTFTANETTAYAIISEEPGIVSGEPVVRLVQRATRMQRKLYDLLPPHWRNRDAESGQGVVLSPAQLADGSMANAGEPGEQFALQRSLRSIGALLGRAYSAADAFGALVDTGEAPTAFLRGYATMFGFYVPEDIDEAHARALVQMQPQVVRKKGVGDFLAATVRAVTGQEVATVNGADRVIRFGEAGTGLAGCWRGLPTAVGSSSITDEFASFEENALVGWTLEWGGETFTVTGNTTTVITLDGDPSAAGVFLSRPLAEVEYYVATAAAPLTFTAGANVITRGDGADWDADGFLTDTYLYIEGSQSDGWYQVASVAADEMELNASIVTHSSDVASVYSGVTAKSITDSFGPFTSEMVGCWLIPNIENTSGPNGSPRAFKLAEVNDSGRVTVSGVGDMRAVASPGSTYRITGEYQLVAPYGGRSDPRPSVYTALPASVFNDRGLMMFVNDDVTGSAKRELEARVLEQVPATTTFELRADDGGAGSADELLLRV